MTAFHWKSADHGNKGFATFDEDKSAKWLMLPCGSTNGRTVTLSQPHAGYATITHSGQVDVKQLSPTRFRLTGMKPGRVELCAKKGGKTAKLVIEVYRPEKIYVSFVELKSEGKSLAKKFKNFDFRTAVNRVATVYGWKTGLVFKLAAPKPAVSIDKKFVKDPSAMKKDKGKKIEKGTKKLRRVLKIGGKFTKYMDKRAAAVGATLGAANGAKPRWIVFLTDDLERSLTDNKDTRGTNPGPYCIMEHISNAKKFAIVLAHEAGHYFHLRHKSGKNHPRNLMTQGSKGNPKTDLKKHTVLRCRQMRLTRINRKKKFWGTALWKHAGFTH